MKVNTAALRAIRIKSGYTQKDVAKYIGISPSMVCQIEKGNRNPGPRVGKRIANFLNVPMEAIYFIQGIDESKP